MLRLSLAHLRRRETRALRALQVAEAARAVAHARLGSGRGDVDALRVALLAGRELHRARARWLRVAEQLRVGEAAATTGAATGRRSVSSPAGAPSRAPGRGSP